MNDETIDARLHRLGISLPAPAAPVAAYVPVVEAGGLAGGVVALHPAANTRPVTRGARSRGNIPHLSPAFSSMLAAHPSRPIGRSGDG